MRVIFHPEAEAELMDAARQYDNARKGLGDEFTDAVQNRVTESARHPSSWPVVRDPVRRVRVPRFPYDVLIAETTHGLAILAVMHHHRHPEYWLDRFQDIDGQ